MTWRFRRALRGSETGVIVLIKASLSAHFRVLDALRETQLDQGRRLDSLEGRLDSLEGRFDSLDGRLGALEGKVDNGFSMLSVGMAQLTALLTDLTREAGEQGLAGQN